MEDRRDTHIGISTRGKVPAAWWTDPAVILQIDAINRYRRLRRLIQGSTIKP